MWVVPWCIHIEVRGPLEGIRPLLPSWSYLTSLSLVRITLNWMKSFFGRTKLVGYMPFIEFGVSGLRAGSAVVPWSSPSLGSWTLSVLLQDKGK